MDCKTEQTLRYKHETEATEVNASHSYVASEVLATIKASDYNLTFDPKIAELKQEMTFNAKLTN